MQLIRNTLIRPNSMRFVNFLTHNFILVKTNVKSTYKRHMDDAQDVNFMTFVHDFYVWCLRAYWSNCIVLPEVVFRYACFLVSSFRCFAKRTFVYDEFHKILLRIVSLHVKLEVKRTQSSIKEKFHKHPVVVLLRKDCSVKHMLWTIFVPLSVAEIHEKQLGISSFLILENFWTTISITTTLHQLFRTNIFQNSYFGLPIEK